MLPCPACRADWKDCHQVSQKLISDMETALRDPRILRTVYHYDGPPGPVPRAYRVPLEALSAHLGYSQDRLIHTVQVHNTRGALALHAPSWDGHRIFMSRTPHRFRPKAPSPEETRVFRGF